MTPRLPPPPSSGSRSFEADVQSNGALVISVPAELVEAVARRAAELVAGRLAPVEDGWLDVDAAARHLCCGRRRIYDLHSQRRIRAHKDGARLLFRRSELDAYLEANAC